MAPSKADDDDPVIAEYDVYITPGLAEQIYLLQHVNRSRGLGYNERSGSRPTDVRIKPQAGFVEMDIAMNTASNFNKFQSLVWGEAMRKAQTAGTSTFGAAAGFAPPAPQKGRGRGGDMSGEPSIDSSLNRFPEAINKNLAFQKQTLGGQILQNEAGNPNYMLGAFRGNELHLTRVDGVVQMRPQFHHVDAVTHQETAARRSEAADENKRSTQALALAQTYKDNRNVEDLEALRAKNLLQIAQEEKWTRLLYFDEDEPESYDAYHERLFAADTEGAPRLKSLSTNEDYLDKISAPRVDPSGRRKKKPLTKRQMAAIELAEDDVELMDEHEPEQQQA